MSEGVDSNLVKVTCPAHHETLIGALWSLFQAKKGTDINIVSGGRPLRAHGIVVSAFLSPEKLLENNLNNDGLDLDAVVQFLYTGTVLVEQDSLDDLERAATLLNFTMLTEAIVSAKASVTSSCNPPWNPCDVSKPVPVEELLEPKPEPEQEADDASKGRFSVFLDEASGVMQVKLDPDDVMGSPVTSPEPDDDDDIEIVAEEAEEEEREVIQLSDDDGEERPTNKRTKKGTARGRGSRRRFGCGECTRTFASRDVRDKHALTHAKQRPHKCPLCPRTFVYHRSLLGHKKTHAGERPLRDRLDGRKGRSGLRRYECEQCGKKFKRSDVLTVHELTHTKTKAYECDVCHKKFAVKSYLTIHSRKHTGEKPYKCKGCDMVFAYSSQCRVHQRIHDNLFDWPS